MIGKPQHTCPVCGEFLPHACAAVVTVQDYYTRRQRWRRMVEITDRPEGSYVRGDRRLGLGGRR